MDDADALSWTSWSGSAWERVLLASGVGNEADGTVPLNDITSDVKRALERLKTSMVRAGMVGGTLKGGLNLFALLARARKRGVRRAAATDAVRDTVSFAAFLVAFAGAYVSVDEGLSLRYGKQRSKSWRAAVAGAVAGPTLLLADATTDSPPTSGSAPSYSSSDARSSAATVSPRPSADSSPPSPPITPTWVS